MFIQRICFWTLFVMLMCYSMFVLWVFIRCSIFIRIFIRCWLVLFRCYSIYIRLIPMLFRSTMLFRCYPGRRYLFNCYSMTVRCYSGDWTILFDVVVFIDVCSNALFLFDIYSIFILLLFAVRCCDICIDVIRYFCPIFIQCDFIRCYYSIFIRCYSVLLPVFIRCLFGID
jgi:hypothetical protein